MNSYQDTLDLIGEDHIATSLETPLRTDAFDIPDDQKIELIQNHFILLVMRTNIQNILFALLKITYAAG